MPWGICLETCSHQKKKNEIYDLIFRNLEKSKYREINYNLYQVVNDTEATS